MFSCCNKLLLVRVSHNSTHGRKVHAEMLGDLLVRISTGRMRSDNGRVSIFYSTLNSGQWRRWGPSLGNRNLYVVATRLKMSLHSRDELVIAQKHLRLDV